MTQAAKGPDALQLDAQSLASLPFPGRSSDLRVYFDQKAHDALSKHAKQDTSVEICGVLVGAWKRDSDGPYVHVTASIPGDAATSKFAEVTFTHETWAKINQRMDKEFADSTIVGWYHTHPDFGVFLSDRDVFIHEHFFSSPGQVALVIDPIRHEEGIFVWKAGKPALTSTHWVGSGQRWSPHAGAAGAERERKREDEPARTAALVEALPPMRTSPIFMLAAAVVFITAGYLAAKYGERQEQYVIAQGLAQQLYNRSASLEILGAAKETRILLAEINAERQRLTAPKKEGEPAPSVDQVAGRIDDRVRRAEREVERILSANALRPEQQAAINAIVAERVDQELKELVARGAITVNKGGAPPASAPASAPASGKTRTPEQGK